MLHVTNGDAVADRLRASGLDGDVLPWRDVLHEGPLPEALDADAMAQVRARFIADCGWGDAAAVLGDFRERDARLARAIATDEPMVLWFEHDLYDQLQLAQILDRLAAARSAGPWWLICIGAHPEVVPFHGLGQLRPDQLAALHDARQPLGRALLDSASAVWRASCESTPASLARLAEAEIPHLPFMRRALRRWLEEFPSLRGGLSVTEERVLEELASGECAPGVLFARCQAREPAPFRGDWSFWRVVAGLTAGHMPFVDIAGGEGFVYPPLMQGGKRFEEQKLRLTRAGAGVMAGSVDAVRVRGIDHWIGGVHLRPGSLWRRHGDGSVAIENRS